MKRSAPLPSIKFIDYSKQSVSGTTLSIQAPDDTLPGGLPFAGFDRGDMPAVFVTMSP